MKTESLVEILDEVNSGGVCDDTLLFVYLGAGEAVDMTTGQSDRVERRIKTHAALVTVTTRTIRNVDSSQEVRHHWSTLPVSL